MPPSQSDAVRSDLCSGCGRWHDVRGRMVLGWRNWRPGHESEFLKLPRGHKPPDYEPDWEPVYGFCVMGGDR